MQEIEYRPKGEEIKKPEKKEEKWLSIEEVAKATKYSEVRLRHLAKAGKIAAQKEKRETGKRGLPWFWEMRIVDVVQYKKSLPSFKEMGAWPPGKGKRKRGRPRVVGIS